MFYSSIRLLILFSAFSGGFSWRDAAFHLKLHGPPGCGKSTVARDLARCLSPRPPTLISGPEIMEMFVGASEANVRGIFEKPPEVPIADMVVNHLLATIDGVNDGSVYTSVDGSDFVQNVVAGEGTMSMYVDPDAWNNDFDYNGNLCNRDEEARVASSKHKMPQRDALG